NLGLFLRDGDGSIEPAERVHQPALARLLTGPDTTLGDCVHFFGRRVAGLGSLLDEVVVDALHHVLHLDALRGREWRERRIDAGILTRHDRVVVDSDLVERSTDRDLAAEDADRSRQRTWLRHDLVAGHRDVIATRRGKARHRDDERPGVVGVARDHQLAPDHVRRQGRSTRAIDAQHDGLDAVVVARITDLLDQGLRSEDGAVERVERTLARGNRSDGIHQRDPGSWTKADRRRGDPLVVLTVDTVLIVIAERGLAIVELVL